MKSDFLKLCREHAVKLENPLYSSHSKIIHTDKVNRWFG